MTPVATPLPELEPASDAGRAIPPCPHFGPCGGCQLQNLSYEAQLADKRRQLESLLEPAGLSLPEIQMHSGQPFGYRNRVRFTLQPYRGLIRAGYLSVRHEETPQDGADPLEEAVPGDMSQAQAQAAFVPVTQCPISADLLWRTTEAFLAEVNGRSITWIERAPFTLDQLELFTDAEESQLQLSLLVRTSARGLPDRFENELTALCEAMRQQIPQLCGAGMYLLPPKAGRSRRAEQPRPGPAWGSRGINYTVSAHGSFAETTYWVPRGSFFQVNRTLLPKLAELVTAGRSGTLAWDLYAGVGLFTKPLATKFQRITSVEVAEPSFTALASARMPNRHAVKSTTLDFLHHAVVQREVPDLILLDPPRTGAGEEVCELLGRIGAREIVYVSCSPHTLPADLATLTAAGYAVTELHLLDLFPQTRHIETVAMLRRMK